MKKLLNGIRELIPTALLAAGAAFIAYGVGMICIPAGVITGGVLSVAAGALMTLGSDSGGEDE